MKDDKKKLYYGQYWPYGVGCGNFTAYAFPSDAARAAWMNKYIHEEEEGDPVACTATYKEMQSAFGKNFCILAADGSVCSHSDAAELNRLDGTKYF